MNEATNDARRLLWALHGEIGIAIRDSMTRGYVVGRLIEAKRSLAEAIKISVLVDEWIKSDARASAFNDERHFAEIDKYLESLSSHVRHTGDGVAR